MTRNTVLQSVFVSLRDHTNQFAGLCGSQSHQPAELARIVAQLGEPVQPVFDTD